jgi:hypothetical protein
MILGGVVRGPFTRKDAIFVIILFAVIFGLNYVNNMMQPNDDDEKQSSENASR